MLNITRGETDGALRFAGALDISTAGAMQEALAEALSRGSSLTVDLAGVESCDTAVMQLLYAARNAAARYQKPFRICAFSSEILKTAAVLGLPLEELSGEGVNA
jgi:anti-anti-sigma factor